MAATSAGALKALIEAGGLGLAVYRDAAPSKMLDGERVPSVPLPYVTVRERIATTPDLDGAFDRAVAHTVRELVQVDLWQQWRGPDGAIGGESYDLPDRLARLLHGATLPAAPTRVYGVSVTGRTRLLELDSNIVHDAITLTIYREQ